MRISNNPSILFNPIAIKEAVVESYLSLICLHAGPTDVAVRGQALVGKLSSRETLSLLCSTLRDFGGAQARTRAINRWSIKKIQESKEKS